MVEWFHTTSLHRSEPSVESVRKVMRSEYVGSVWQRVCSWQKAHGTNTSKRGFHIEWRTVVFWADVKNLTQRFNVKFWRRRQKMTTRHQSENPYTLEHTQVGVGEWSAAFSVCHSNWAEPEVHKQHIHTRTHDTQTHTHNSHGHTQSHTHTLTRTLTHALYTYT